MMMMIYLSKKFYNRNYFMNLLSRFQSYDFIQSYGYVHDITLIERGPIAVLKNKIAKGELMKDEYQMKVTKTLQNIYEEINGYKPEEFSLLDKWLGRKRKQPPKGLYLYGAVGGGKTMLMDLFYQCCQVSQLIIYIIIAHGEPKCVLLIINMIIHNIFQHIINNKIIK